MSGDGRRILVIDPATGSPETDCFNHLWELSGDRFSYHVPAFSGLASIRAAERGAAAIILFGSASSVNDGLPWQKELGEWLGPMLERGVPTLGICWGHQFIAAHFGGRVEFVRPDKALFQGFRRVVLDPDPAWGEGRTGELFAAHREHVVALPSCMTSVGRSEGAPHEALRHSALPIRTFQPHIEATPGFALSHGGTRAEPGRFRFGHALVRAFLEFSRREG